MTSARVLTTAEIAQRKSAGKKSWQLRTSRGEDPARIAREGKKRRGFRLADGIRKMTDYAIKRTYMWDAHEWDEELLRYLVCEVFSNMMFDPKFRVQFVETAKEYGAFGEDGGKWMMKDYEERENNGQESHSLQYTLQWMLV